MRGRKAINLIRIISSTAPRLRNPSPFVKRRISNPCAASGAERTASRAICSLVEWMAPSTAMTIRAAKLAPRLKERARGVTGCGMARPHTLAHLHKGRGERTDVGQAPASAHQAPKELDVDQPGVLFGDLAVIESDQGRNAADAVARGNARLLVDIDLGEAGARLELLCRAIEDRGHRAAGTAPRRPEVDDHGHVV